MTSKFSFIEDYNNLWTAQSPPCLGGSLAVTACFWHWCSFPQWSQWTQYLWQQFQQWRPSIQTWVEAAVVVFARSWLLHTFSLHSTNRKLAYHSFTTKVTKNYHIITMPHFRTHFVFSFSLPKTTAYDTMHSLISTTTWLWLTSDILRYENVFWLI